MSFCFHYPVVHFLRKLHLLLTIVVPYTQSFLFLILRSTIIRSCIDRYPDASGLGVSSLSLQLFFLYLSGFVEKTKQKLCITHLSISLPLSQSSLFFFSCCFSSTYIPSIIHIVQRSSIYVSDNLSQSIKRHRVIFHRTISFIFFKRAKRIYIQFCIRIFFQFFFFVFRRFVVRVLYRSEARCWLCIFFSLLLLMIMCVCE